LRPTFLIAIVVAAELLHIGAAYLNTRIAAISRVNMAGNLLGNFFLFYAAALLGVFVFVVIGYRVRSFHAFNYLGMNSLLILATHKPLLLILNTHLGRYLDIPLEVYGLIATLIVLAASVPIISFINRKVPQVIGKKPLFRLEIPLEWIREQKHLSN
jgi:fucose 4-O-acetylase-like acetyltransferase